MPILPRTGERTKLAVGEVFKPTGRYVGPWIPEAVAASKDLSLGAKLAYGVLVDFGDKVFPSYRTIAERMGLGRTQAIRYVKELEIAKLLLIESHGHHGHTNRFRFTWQPFLESSFNRDDVRDPDHGDVRDPDHGDVRDPDHRTNQDNQPNETTKQKQNPAAAYPLVLEALKARFPDLKESHPWWAKRTEFLELDDKNLSFWIRRDEFVQDNPEMQLLKACDQERKRHREGEEIPDEWSSDPSKSAFDELTRGDRALRRSRRVGPRPEPRSWISTGAYQKSLARWEAGKDIYSKPQRVHSGHVSGCKTPDCDCQLWVSETTAEGESLALCARCDSDRLKPGTIRTRDRIEAMLKEGLSFDEIRDREKARRKAA